ncbi:hypothetical protein ABK040_008687 [Willaertia magna]
MMNIFFDSQQTQRGANNNNGIPPNKQSNTFFDEKFNKDLFASFTSDMPTPTPNPTTSTSSSSDQAMIDYFNDPMNINTPTSSSSNGSTFFTSLQQQATTTNITTTQPQQQPLFEVAVDMDESPFNFFSSKETKNPSIKRNISEMKEEPKVMENPILKSPQRQALLLANNNNNTNNVTTTIAAGKGRVQQKKKTAAAGKKKKNKPTINLNLLNNNNQQELAVDNKENKNVGGGVVGGLGNDNNNGFGGGMDDTTYSQFNYEISASGSFCVQDLRIGRSGITCIPATLTQSMSQSGSPYKASPYRNNSQNSQQQLQYNQSRDISVMYNSEEVPKKRKPLKKKLKSMEKLDNIKFENLETVNKLGEGASGSVDLVYDTVSGKQYARKAMKIGAGIQPKLILSEIKSFYKLRECPYVVTFYDAFYIDDKIYMILELMDGNSLECFTKVKVPERILGLITYQVMKGLFYLHSKGIVHRDIKPGNILVKKDGSVKISDMGLTGTLSRTKHISKKYGLSNEHVWKTCQGTIIYMSPERIGEQEHSYNSDIWSYGITLLELALGKFPFRTDTYFEVMDQVTSMEQNNPVVNDPSFSHLFKDFIIQSLKVNPLERANSKDLSKHGFITQFDGLNEDIIRSEIATFMRQHNLC